VYLADAVQGRNRRAHLDPEPSPRSSASACHSQSHRHTLHHTSTTEAVTVCAIPKTQQSNHRTRSLISTSRNHFHPPIQTVGSPTATTSAYGTLTHHSHPHLHPHLHAYPRQPVPHPSRAQSYPPPGSQVLPPPSLASQIPILRRECEGTFLPERRKTDPATYFTSGLDTREIDEKTRVWALENAASKDARQGKRVVLSGGHAGGGNGGNGPRKHGGTGCRSSTSSITGNSPWTGTGTGMGFALNPNFLHSFDAQSVGGGVIPPQDALSDTSSRIPTPPPLDSYWQQRQQPQLWQQQHQRDGSKSLFIWESYRILTMYLKVQIRYLLPVSISSNQLRIIPSIPSVPTTRKPQYPPRIQLRNLGSMTRSQSSASGNWKIRRTARLSPLL
jgi:hypothetical protein